MKLREVHTDSSVKRVIAIVLVGLAVLTAYQVYAYRTSHRNAHAVVVAKKAQTTAAKNAAKLRRLTKAQCGSTQLLYTLLNALMDDSSPGFGSPAGGPIVPGARDALIHRVHAAEAASYTALRKQGCRIPAK